MVRIVVADINIFINLVHAGLVSVLPTLTEFEFVIPGAVLAEITYPAEHVMIETAIADGTLRIVQLENETALVDYLELRDLMGRGEAACLALATQDPEWLLASDERKVFRRAALQRMQDARILTTPRIILRMIQAGALSVEAADAAKAVLEANRFKMSFASFRDLL